MSETTTSSRLLTLLSLLQGRRYWPGGELADRLGVSGRTIRRDVDRLRDLGYPVESVTGPAGGYQLRAGTAMPPLLLDDDEAIAIAVGLRTAAGASVAGVEETALRALVKLEQVLPAHLRRRVHALQSTTSTLTFGGGPQIDPQSLSVIAAACRDHERVRFAYRARDQTDSRRDVEPHALVNAGRRWYLVAFDGSRGGWRMFRLDRLSRPASTGLRFTPRKIPAKDAAAFVAQSLKTAPYRYEARVTLHAPAQELERRRWLGGTVTPVGADRCEFVGSDDNLDWLAMRIAMLGVDFEAHEPPELVQRLRELGARIARGVAPR
jgi:predicted DNA-binding transcriptional regulator YafY